MKKQKSRASFSLIRRLLIILTTGFPDQNFLGASYIPLLLQLMPAKLRKNLALDLLSISPHYFGTVPSDVSRRDYIEAEHQRMLLTRKSMIEKKVKSYLSKNMTVLDHGCGPGYLAIATSPFCDRVIAVDISSGVIACAKAINNKPNIKYITESGAKLSHIENSSIDLIYSFAVMQHVTDDICQKILQEFYRVLKPQGKVICEFVVDRQNKDVQSMAQPSNVLLSKLKERYMLRVIYRPFPKIEKFIQNSGLEIDTFKANSLDYQHQDTDNSDPYFTFVLAKS